MVGGTSDPNLVEMTRRLFSGLNEGDVGAFIASLGPDPVFDVSPWGFGVYEGNRAIRRFLEDWIGSVDAYERVPQEIVDLGGGIIFAAAVTRGVPAGGRTEIRLPGASVVVWADEKIVRVINYRDADEARLAAERLAESRE